MQQPSSRRSIVVYECFLLFVRVDECVYVCVLVGKCTNQIQKKMIFYATFFSLCWNKYICSSASFSFFPQCFCTIFVPEDGICSTKISSISASFLYSQKIKVVSPACSGRRDARKHAQQQYWELPTRNHQQALLSANQKRPELQHVCAHLCSRALEKDPVRVSRCGWTRPAPSTSSVSAVAAVKVLEPLESSSKLCWFLVKVPRFLLPQKHRKTFSFSSLEGGAEEVRPGVCRSVGGSCSARSSPNSSRDLEGVLGGHGVPGAGPLCFAVVFLEQVAISCSVAMHVCRRRLSAEEQPG